MPKAHYFFFFFGLEFIISFYLIAFIASIETEASLLALAKYIYYNIFSFWKGSSFCDTLQFLS